MCNTRKYLDKVDNFKIKEYLNNITINIWYNPKKIKENTILEKIFDFEDNKYITGEVKIISNEKDEKFELSINKKSIYNKLKLNVNFIYDIKYIDFTYYTMLLENKVRHNGYNGLFGVDAIEILSKENRISSKLINC